MLHIQLGNERAAKTCGLYRTLLTGIRQALLRGRAADGDYEGEQQMEVEALEAILMDEFERVDDTSGLGMPANKPCYLITISPKGDDEEETTPFPVRLALYFAHTPTYPDEPPLLSLRSLQGVRAVDLEEIRNKLKEEAEENLGMAMMYTLATSAKEWLREKYVGVEEEEEEEEKEEVIEPHGLPVTVETFTEWRDRFEAEIALEKAKLLSDAALAASKEKRLTGRQWFVQKASKGIVVDEEEAEEEEEEEIDFDDDDFDEDIDEDDMLDHYLAEKNQA
ncbi:unnamed protein product [Closterium sp. Naga37s-1]|nr:unnamed protein product [Closterium sp. Naga37s-1]